MLFNYNYIFIFYKTTYLNVEVNRSKPFPLVSVPCWHILCCASTPNGHTAPYFVGGGEMIKGEFLVQEGKAWAVVVLVPFTESISRISDV
jgi:hypothetical protein